MSRNQIQRLVQSAVTGQKSVAEVVESLLSELGRGGRILVVDENLAGLEAELSQLNYTTYLVKLGEDDQSIKDQLRGRILVTSNGKDFVRDCQRYRYGLIWVLKSGDYKALAKKIETVLMRCNFSRDISQSVKI